MLVAAIRSVTVHQSDCTEVLVHIHVVVVGSTKVIHYLTFLSRAYEGRTHTFVRYQVLTQRNHLKSVIGRAQTRRNQTINFTFDKYGRV